MQIHVFIAEFTATCLSPEQSRNMHKNMVFTGSRTCIHDEQTISMSQLVCHSSLLDATDHLGSETVCISCVIFTCCKHLSHVARQIVSEAKCKGPKPEQDASAHLSNSSTHGHSATLLLDPTPTARMIRPTPSVTSRHLPWHCT